VATSNRGPAAAGVAGLVFAVLFVTAVALVYPQPPQNSTAAAITKWYLTGSRQAIGLVGLYLIPFAGIAFLWFIAAVRVRIGSQEDQFFATTLLASGVLFVVFLWAGAAAAGAPLAAVKFQGAPPPSPDVFVYARGLAYALVYVYGIRAAAVFMLVTSTIGLRTGTLPRPLVILGYVVAIVLMFSVSFSRGFVLVFPLWVAAVSVELLRRRQVRSDDRPPLAATSGG